MARFILELQIEVFKPESRNTQLTTRSIRKFCNRWTHFNTNRQFYIKLLPKTIMWSHNDPQTPKKIQQEKWSTTVEQSKVSRSWIGTLQKTDFKWASQPTNQSGRSSGTQSNPNVPLNTARVPVKSVENGRKRVPIDYGSATRKISPYLK